MRVAGHVARGAIRIFRDDEELLRTAGQVHLRFLREKLDALCATLGDAVELGAVQNPLAQELMFARTGLDRLATFMRDFAERLEQHERVIHVHAVEAATGEIVHQRSVVVFRIVAAQGKLEAVLALGRAVTGAGIATGLREHGLDVANEIDPVRLGALDFDGQLRLLPAGLDADIGGPGRLRLKITARSNLHAGRVRAELRLGSEVNGLVAVYDTQNQDATFIPRILERERRRFEFERANGGQGRRGGGGLGGSGLVRAKQKRGRCEKPEGAREK